MSYTVNEIFYSVQGEGHRAGTANVFVRFAGCNLRCAWGDEAGFDCDTEFSSGRKMSSGELLHEVRTLWGEQPSKPQVILTGGEPLLQVDKELLEVLLPACGVVAVETNGTIPGPEMLDLCFVSCSPKTAEHTLRVRSVEELRYVRHVGQALPKPMLTATHHFVSPAFSVNPQETRRNLEHCISLVKADAAWRLSTQQHKLWGVR